MEFGIIQTVFFFVLDMQFAWLFLGLSDLVYEFLEVFKILHFIEYLVTYSTKNVAFYYFCKRTPCVS